MQIPVHVEEAIRERAGGGTFNAYIYDTRIMRARLRELSGIMPAGVELFYAMKANPHPAFLAAAREAEGIEIASLGEAEKAVAAGFSPARLMYTGLGKDPDELHWSAVKGVVNRDIVSVAAA